MNARTQQIDRLFWKVVEIARPVTKVHDAASEVVKPLETYFTAAGLTGSLAKSADEDLQKLLKISVEARRYANSFKANGINKWKDAGWLIENMTSASPGAKASNQRGIATLRDLKTKVQAVREVTEVVDQLALAFTAVGYVDVKSVAQDLTSMSGVNVLVCQRIKTINAGTRADLSKFLPNVDQAIDWLGKM